METKLSISNPHPVKLPGPQLLHQLVPQRAKDDAAAIEFIFEDGTHLHLSYDELHSHANALAHRIIAANGDGNNPQLIVPIFIQQCPQLYISQLASLKAGAAFCPISLDVPKDRLRFILQDLGARVLLTTEELKQRLPDLNGLHIITVGTNEPNSDTSEPKAVISPRHTAYVMYTSGSTGQPKGVIISHLAASQALLAHDGHIPEFKRFLQFASPTFDVSIFEIFFPWFRGRTIVGCSRKQLLNELPSVITRLDIDAVELTPSVVSSLLCQSEDLPSLKVLLTIGEMLKPSVVQKFGCDSEESGVLHGMYGPTEATIHCTLEMYFARNTPCSNIGMPLDTVSTFVIRQHDENQPPGLAVEVLPVGEAGELAIGGFQLADGYLNRDEQTKSCFVYDPKYGRLYRTGDLVRMSQDGKMHYIGRISSGQVKLRGQRIELGEIENAASKAQNCRDVVAEVLNGILILFCLADPSLLSKSSVFDACRAWLPEFMVPQEVVIMQAFPYLPSGKLDREALRTEYIELTSSSEINEQLKNGRTRMIFEIMGSILGIEVRQNSVLQNLGLDSLTSIRLAAELQRNGFLRPDATELLAARSALDIAASLRQSYTAPIPINAVINEELAKVQTAIEDKVRKALNTAQLEEIEEVLPCTAVQSAMLSETFKTVGAYCNWVEFKISASTDVQLLDTAIHELCKRHKALRSGFVTLTDKDNPFALVVWKRIQPRQIEKVVNLNFDFQLRNERCFLRPCNFQVVSKDDKLHLLLKIHHALYDHWSIDVLRRDLKCILKGESLGVTSSFDLMARYQVCHHLEGTSPESLEFWYEHLRDFAPSHLPQLRGERKSSSIQRSPWHVMEMAPMDVKSKSRELRCSPPTVFQAAFAFLLSSYVGTDDITFGSVSSGRTMAVPGIEYIFGPCLATLPLRLNINAVHTGQDLLAAVTSTKRSIEKRILTPPTMIKKIAGIAANEALYNTVFVWQETSLGYGLENDLVQVTGSEDHNEFDLVLEIEPSATQIKARATYQERVVSSQQIEILLKHLEFLASKLIETPSIPVKNLAADLNSRLLSVSNPHPDRFTDTPTVLTKIEKQVAKHAASPALIFATKLGDTPRVLSMSYEELNTNANKMANYLMRSGVCPGDILCICMEKSIELYISVLAAIKAGAGYLPLLPETPSGRIESVLKETQVKFCLCDSASHSNLPSTLDLIMIDVGQLDYSQSNSTNPPVVQQGFRTAYAISTSGTTGKPKIMAISMESLHSNLEALSELYGAKPGDRLLQACSQAFDVSVFEIFFAFSTGMTLCSAPKDILFFDLERSIRTFQTTHLSLTPTVAALIDPINVPDVRFLVTAGEGLTTKVHQQWAGCGLHQGYGPSETTNICTVNMNMTEEHLIGNIGPALRNTSAFVLAPNEDFRILPLGSHGELAFGGEQVFRGYINRNDLTSAQVVDHPDFGRVYRSGDMGRMLPDGSLVISGRTDDQIKIRGNRVEIGEISSVVLNHSGVFDCTTVLHQNPLSEKLLVTFWIPVSESKTGAEDVTLISPIPALTSDLFLSLKEALPSYMVPSALIPINRLPLTSHGKIDSSLLRSIFEGLDDSTRNMLFDVQDGQMPNQVDGQFSYSEKNMAEKLSSVLHIPSAKMSRHSSFFALGLNSVNAIAFAKSLEDLTNCRPSVSTVLRNASIARLSQALDQGAVPVGTEPVDNERSKFSSDFIHEVTTDFAARGYTVEAIHTCTPLQEAMLSASAAIESNAYCNNITMKIVGNLQMLKKCWEEMLSRHASLRTAFVETDSPSYPYAQVVLKIKELPWRHRKLDSLSNCAVNDNSDVIASHRVADHLNPIQFEVKEIGDEMRLEINIHHAIYDGIALSSLFEEIEKFYTGEKLPAPLPLEPFLAEIKAHNTSESTRFWSERFRDFRPVPLAKPPQIHYNSTTLSKRMISSSMELDSFCKRYSVTPLSVFQAAWAKTLSCVQSAPEVCFGNVVSGRSASIPEIQRLVAPCFNTIPLRVKLDTFGSNIDLIRNLHQQNIDSLQFQLTALRLIQSLSAKPSVHLFDSLVLLQHAETSLDPDIWTIECETGDYDLPMVMEIIPQSESYKMRLHFWASIVSVGLAENLGSAFVSALGSCIRYPLSSNAHFLDFERLQICAQLSPESPMDESCKNDTFQESSSDDAALQWDFEEDLIRKTFARFSLVDQSKITKRTSLYELGLDSLNAVQVASKIRRSGYEVSSADVMQYMTPSALASYLKVNLQRPSKRANAIDFDAFEAQYKPDIVDSLMIQNQAVECVRPCTPTQQAMIAQSLQTSGNLYVNHIEFRVSIKYTSPQLQLAWKAVQRKHQVLRMGFSPIENDEYPFAMLVYASEATNLCSAAFDKDIPEEDLETSSKANIMRHLHLPAWRVSFDRDSTGLKMHLSMHHAIYDANSLRLLLSDLMHALRSESLGPITNFDPLLHETLTAAKDESGITANFWKEKLGSTRPVKFPDLSPITVSTGALISKKICARSTKTELAEYCKRESSTIQSLGQCIWAILLAAYTGDPMVIFGIVLSGHHLHSLQQVAFPNITTVPVCCNTSKPWLDALTNMVSYNASVRNHRFASLSSIQRFAGDARQALFDTLFVYQNSTFLSDSDEYWQVISETAAVDYVLSMEIEETAAGLIKLRLTFNTSFIPTKQASLMLEQYDHILDKIIHGQLENESWNSNLYSVLPAKEKRLPSPVRLLHQFVEQGAEQHPHKLALEFITGFGAAGKVCKTWTYKEFDEGSNQVAHFIHQSGVEPGSIVAVCMSKSAEASLAFVGILKSGCTFLAIDPDMPSARREFILEDSNAQLIFVDQQNEIEKDGHAISVVCKRDLFADMSTSAVPISVIGPDTISYCLYTSGSTGNPKACLLSHENAVQALMSFQRLFAGHWSASSRWLQFASYWFDVSVLEQFWSWSVGIAVVGAPRDLVLEDLAGFIQSAEITHIDLTPSLARLLRPEDVPTLWNGVFITGGESLKQEIIDAWGPKRVVCNGYGPTEATIGVTMNRFLGPGDKPSNIGPQFDNVGTIVLKPETEDLVLRGGVGELCITGSLVGKGYLNRPDLTAQHFPYLKKHKTQTYRTGDLVRLLSNGSFSFIGRYDTQTKLRGQRLDTQEIETVITWSINGAGQVTTIVAKVREDNRETLLSFVTTVESNGSELFIDTSKTAMQLVHVANRACNDKLPTYMVPTHIIPVSQIPLTVNNKIDTKRLVALFESLSSRELEQLRDVRDEERQLSQAETEISQIFSRLLSINATDITPRSNIFSLGLSSISAINFTTSLKRNGFPKATVTCVMNNPTLGRLAELLSSDEAGDQTERNAVRQAKLSISAFAHRYRSICAQALLLDISEIEALSPCTPLQEGLLIESIRHEQRSYFNHFIYDCPGINLPKLNLAISKLVENVAVLRSVFVRTDEGFAQVILKAHSTSVDSYSVDDGESPKVLATKKREWLSSANEEMLRPFEIFIVQTKTKTSLIVHAHHAIYDGISWDLMMKCLSRAYRCDSEVDYGPDFFEALPYGPLCRQMNSQSFWEHRLGGVSFSSLPKLSINAPGSDPFVQRNFQLSEMTETCRKEIGVSHQGFYQAAFEIALQSSFPKTQVYGMVVSGRSIEFENAGSVIGPMFNTLPCPIEIGLTDSWTDHHRRCHELTAASIPFQHTPLKDIRKLCKLDPSESLFDVLFVFQQRDDEALDYDSSPFQQVESSFHPDYPLSVEIELLNQREIAITAVAQRSVATEAMLHSLVDNVMLAIDCSVRNLDQNISDVFSVCRSWASADQSTSLQPSSRQMLDLGTSDKFVWNSEARLIRETIAQLAGRNAEDIKEDTSVFALGLDSIDAVKVASRLKKDGLNIAVSSILQSQTIPKMLAALHGQKKFEAVTDISNRLSTFEDQLQPLRQVFSQQQTEIERILPATPNQEALIADMIRSDLQDYYNHDILRISPHVDISRLKSSWQKVIDASPILRTSFVAVTNLDVDTVFAQVVHTPSLIRIEETTAASFETLNDILEEIRKLAIVNSSQMLPLRLTLVHVDSDQYLILSLAHAQYDGHSLALLHKDVARAYYDEYEPRPQYDQTIELALSATSKESLSFWRNTFAGVRIVPLPPRAVQTSEWMVHRVNLTCQMTTSKAQSFCQNLGISLQTLAQTSWALVLAECTKSLEVMFGVVLACRDNEESEQVMFPTMNTVPLRAILHDSIRQMLQYVQGMMNDALKFQKTSLRSIQAACSDVVHRESSSISNELFDNLFIYHHTSKSNADHREPLYESVDDNANISYPLAMEIEGVGDALIIRAACKDPILDHEGAIKLLHKYDQVLDSIVNAPDQAAVQFHGATVSVCGLPSFEPERQLEIGRGSDLVNKSVDNGGNDTNRSTAYAIRSTLARVARIPENEIGLRDTIESIGIDSISAIKVVATLREGGINLSVSDLLRARTSVRMAELADAIGGSAMLETISSENVVMSVMDQLDLSDVHSRAGVDAHNVQIIIPATAGQIYMLYVYRRTNGQLFFSTFSYTIKTRKPIKHLQKAWKKTVSRNTILRTVFCTTGSTAVPLVQIILRKPPVNFFTEKHVETREVNKCMVALVARKTADGFLIELGLHHALYDAVSLPLIFQDFREALADLERPTSNVKFEDFIALSLTPTSRTSRRQFWTQYLDGTNLIQLHRPKSQATQRRTEVFQPNFFASCNRLNHIARAEGVTLQAIIFAAYSKWYAKRGGWSAGSNDAILGIYLSNRGHLRDLDTLATPTLNLVPLRVRLSDRKRLIDIAKEIHADLQQIGSVENSSVTLLEIERWTGVKIDTFLNFLKLPEQDSIILEAPVDFITPLDDARREERRKVVENTQNELVLPPGLQDLEIQEAYQDSVDVEITASNGSLDVGVFGLEQTISLEDADILLRELKAELQSLLE